MSFPTFAIELHSACKQGLWQLPSIWQLTHLELDGRPNEQEVMSKSWVQAACCQGYDLLVYIEVLHLRLGSIQLVRAVDAYLATCNARRMSLSSHWRSSQVSAHARSQPHLWWQMPAIGAGLQVCRRPAVLVPRDLQ